MGACGCLSTRMSRWRLQGPPEPRFWPLVMLAMTAGSVSTCQGAATVVPAVVAVAASKRTIAWPLYSQHGLSATRRHSLSLPLQLFLQALALVLGFAPSTGCRVACLTCAFGSNLTRSGLSSQSKLAHAGGRLWQEDQGRDPARLGAAGQPDRAQGGAAAGHVQARTGTSQLSVLSRQTCLLFDGPAS